MFRKTLESTIGVIRRWTDLLTFGGVIALIGLVVIAAFEAYWRNFGERMSLEEAAGFAVALSLVTLESVLFNLFTALFRAGMTHLVLARMRGGQMTFGEAMGFAYKQAGTIVLYSLLLTAGTLIISNFFSLILFQHQGLMVGPYVVNHWTSVIGTALPRGELNLSATLQFLFGLTMLIWFTANALVYPVMASERTSSWAALKRSVWLVRRDPAILWGAIGVTVIAALIWELKLDLFLIEFALTRPEGGYTRTLYDIIRFGGGIVVITISTVFCAAWYLVAAEAAAPEFTPGAD